MHIFNVDFLGFSSIQSRGITIWCSRMVLLINYVHLYGDVIKIHYRRLDMGQNKQFGINYVPYLSPSSNYFEFKAYIRRVCNKRKTNVNIIQIRGMIIHFKKQSLAHAGFYD